VIFAATEGYGNFSQKVKTKRATLHYSMWAVHDKVLDGDIVIKQNRVVAHPRMTRFLEPNYPEGTELRFRP